VKKILFLDIDGVLVTMDSLCNSASGRAAAFCIDAVDNLNKLIEETEAKVVVSSTWRIGVAKCEMQQELNKRGVNCEVVDFTPQTFGRHRSREIGSWLDEENDIHYVILDDDLGPSYNPFFGHRAVVTSMAGGFDEDSLEEALRLFAKCDDGICDCISGEELRGKIQVYQEDRYE